MDTLKQTSLSITSENLKFLQDNLFKSLSNTLNWYIEDRANTGNIPFLQVLSNDKITKVVRISTKAKDFIQNNKIANSNSYTVNCILQAAREQNITPFK